MSICTLLSSSSLGSGVWQVPVCCLGAVKVAVYTHAAGLLSSNSCREKPDYFFTLVVLKCTVVKTVPELAAVFMLLVVKLKYVSLSCELLAELNLSHRSSKSSWPALLCRDSRSLWDSRSSASAGMAEGWHSCWGRLAKPPPPAQRGR